MRVDLFMLADSAEFDAEGKLKLSGGGVTHVSAEEAPFYLDRMTAVVRFIVEEDDFRRDHEVQIQWLRPDGTIIEQSKGLIRGSAILRRPHPGEEHAVILTATHRMVQFETFGIYRVRLLVNGDVQSEKPLAVVQAAERGTVR